MYIPSHFQETRLEVMHGLMMAHPLAALVMRVENGFDANHIPLYLSVDEGSWGTLRGHLARASPLWQTAGGNDEVLAIFRGADAYISPSWYPTKSETGKDVPTWNYAVVHAHGKLHVRQDSAWIRRHLEELTDQHERRFSTPWQVADAPEDFVERMVGQVVGIEIPILRLEGKWKASQNQPAQNRQGVVQGLREHDGEAECPMAGMVEAVKLHEN